MSILKKPYEISVWEDIWKPEEDEGKGRFVEQRLGVIGSDKMLSQARVIEPQLTRNVNGTKKLSFKMYRYYVDNETGEKVENPFISWLTSERKVKLKYGIYIDNNGEVKDCWYDFIIKQVNENSSNYLYTYQLEDALVQELSKNGFGVTLDTALMNNIGTAQELAETVLEETDWEVESEVFVQTVEEGLVYVNIPAGTYQKITDQTSLIQGVTAAEASLSGGVGLAFYSCCKNKPHRFQFIYLSKGYKKEDVITDNRGVIDEVNCQYYLDIPTPEADYTKQDSFFLPTGWTSVSNPEAVDKNGQNDTTISSWYRGKRYGFAQTAKYVPLLERYCNVYKKNGVEYYGYVDNEYTSPALLQNVITNMEFKGTSGWVGTYAGTTGNVKSSVGAKVESVYGRFINKKFVSVIDDLSNGSYDEDNDYIAYLKVIFPAKQSGNYPILLNTGFYDNRTLIKNTSNGDKWCFGYEFLNSFGIEITSGFRFVMQEVSYNTDRGNYNLGNVWATIEDGDMVFKNDTISDEDFKEKEVKLVIVPTTNNEQIIYIKNMHLYRKVLNDNGEVIIPGEVDTEGAIETKYYLFAKSQLDTVESVDGLVYDVVDTINYNTYVPVYNTGANKVRSVTAKESNYFNILQSIAETFECWVDLKIRRNSLGAIQKKIVCLKNYIGKNNYACFRYGVNLKDIQRTYESKNIVTKLIVKQNSNEHGKNGFCTIARAGSNPTGENYIYDFSYFHNMGLLDTREYLGCVYYDTNPFDGNIKETGKDLGPEHSTESYNLQNYFNRIKNINEKLAPIGEELAGLQTDLAKYSAELRVQEGLRDAADNSLEETIDDFYALTGLLPTQISTEDIDTTATSVASLLKEYATYKSEYNRAVALIGNFNEATQTGAGLMYAVGSQKKAIEDKIAEREEWLDHKIALNKLFFTKYSRFIQEGTWISEEYVDDDKYYVDAQSVMYNSCYPQVAYSINVLSLSGLPGYEHFDFEVGDKTFAEDYEFFGEDNKEEVVITEISENLDDPSKNVIKVQNFKNQFQDLFQKITATVQQTQYSTGSYQKAVALAEADDAVKGKFVTEGLETYGQKLGVAGQTTVVQDENGITLTDSATKDQMRLIGGAIMMSVEDEETGQRSWKTGLTPEGISASMIYAGTLNAGKIQIMNVNEPVFRWDAYGLSAFDANWQNGVIGTPNPYKFVRYDKYGIYGINFEKTDENAVNGISWKPSSIDEIDRKATFALTWEGLKVTGNDGVSARIGKVNNNIIEVAKPNEDPVFSIDTVGKVKITAEIEATGGKIAEWKLSDNGLYNYSATHQIGLEKTSKILDANDTLGLYYLNLDEASDAYQQYIYTFNWFNGEVGSISTTLHHFFGSNNTTIEYEFQDENGRLYTGNPSFESMSGDDRTLIFKKDSTEINVSLIQNSLTINADIDGLSYIQSGTCTLSCFAYPNKGSYITSNGVLTSNNFVLRQGKTIMIPYTYGSRPGFLIYDAVNTAERATVSFLDETGIEKLTLNTTNLGLI